jgi:hypothetical protein
MRTARTSVILLALTLAVLTPGAGQEPPAPPKGEVELQIRRPDGKPAAGAEVRVGEGAPSPGPRATEATGKTDDKGLVRFSWPLGVGRMQVSVPGIGYGTTGLFEVVPGRTARAPLAPLAPFAVLEGIVPEKLRGPKTTVRLAGIGWPDRQTITVATDADGRFRAEMPGGRWSVQAVAGDGPPEPLGPVVVAIPGQRTSLRQPPPPDAPPGAGPPRVDPPPQPARGTTVAWATGTVRDQSGKPVAGATVWALAVHHGGIRMYEKLEKATTGADGKYEIKGEGALSMFSAAIVAAAPGKPPAWAWIQQTGGPAADLVLPDRGGGLAVAVVRDGKPAVGVKVGAWLEGVNLRDTWAAGESGDERNKLEAAIHPVVTTDAEGVAKFEYLLPGRYHVIAAEGDERRVRGLRESWRGRDPGPHGIAAGIPVGLGRTTTHQLAIYEQPLAATVRVFKPDGAPLTGEGIPYDYSAVHRGGWSTSQKLDAEGAAKLGFEAPGLWRVSFKYRASPVTSIPLRGEPYTAAEGVVAVSALLPADKTPPTRLTARRFEPGSVVVELKDAAGKPARGVVELSAGGMSFAGSTDEAGVVRFEAVPTWKYDVRGYIAERQPVDLGSGGGPVPEERLLRGVIAIMPEQVTTAANTERRVVLQEQKVGYVLCRLQPPKGRTAADYQVYAEGENWSEPERIRYRRGTGEFVAGPFAPGKVRLVAWGPTKTEPKDVTLAAGEVTKVELVPTAEEVKPVAEPESVLLGPGGLSMQGSGGLSGRVLLPGGKEPALGAVVMHFGPRGFQPTLGGLTDATGRIRGKGLWYAGASGTDSPDDPPGPLVVALLPGAHGAVIATPAPGKPLELVLPSAKALRGRVTAGGAAPTGVSGSVRVLAAYEGQGRLNGVCSVQTTAQADGAFELAGLTPGRYRVQAALDDIWLSPTVTVEVADKPLAEAKLAIPAPGGAAVVTVVDPDGKPLPGRAVTVDRPTGPLTGQLWPAGWVTDGAGTVTIPALEAGRHTVRATGTDVSTEVVVPPLPTDRPAEGRLRVARPDR